MSRPNVTNLFIEKELAIDITGSEPRDILMTERTGLTWIKFSVTLATVAVTIITNFRLETEKQSPDYTPPSWLPAFSYGVAVLFVLLSMATLCVGGASYVQSIYNYRMRRVNTFSFATALGFLLFVGLVLLGINIVFMVAVRGS